MVLSETASEMKAKVKKKPSTRAEVVKAKKSVLSIGMGSSYASMIIAGFIVGYVIDSYFDTKPIFIIVCGLMGFIGGLQKLHRMLELEEGSSTNESNEK